jgi:histidyl-tRNA synthetase
VSFGLSGFPEFLPNQWIAHERIIHGLRQLFEQSGFVPMETPAIEKATTLMANGNDHEIYGVHRLNQLHDTHDLALRFDLTVPLTRYVTQHQAHLHFPYRRYHIAPVWRGERPQLGRYRQFYQCDVDVVHRSELSVHYDAEILTMAVNALSCMTVAPVKMYVNHCAILRGLLGWIGVPEASLSDVIRVVDKARKKTPLAMLEALQACALTTAQCQQLCALLYTDIPDDWCAFLHQTHHPECLRGLSELRAMMHMAAQLGLPEGTLHINPLLARGLTYYTGLLFETEWPLRTDVGSVCSGGRYQRLGLTGVGLSIGLSRVLSVLSMHSAEHTTAITCIAPCDNQYDQAIQAAHALRASGIASEIFFQSSSLRDALSYAHKKGFKSVLFFEKQHLILKWLSTGEQQMGALSDVIQWLKTFIHHVL